MQPTAAAHISLSQQPTRAAGWRAPEGARLSVRWSVLVAGQDGLGPTPPSNALLYAAVLLKGGAPPLGGY